MEMRILEVLMLVDVHQTVAHQPGVSALSGAFNCLVFQNFFLF